SSSRTTTAILLVSRPHHFEALYGRKYRSPVYWTKFGEAQIVSPELIQETTEKIVQIMQGMQAARDRQKSYADLKCKPMEFQVGDKVMLKVSPWKRVVRFGKWGKLNPRYVGPFKVLERIGDVSYKLNLPEELSRLIRKACCVEANEKQKQSTKDMMLELVKICQEKEFLCIHDDVDDLIEIAPILSTKEPEHLLSMRYEHLSITPETEYDEVTKSNAENLLPILSECEVSLEDNRECDLPISENSPVCDNHSDIFIDSKINDDILVYDDDFEDIKYVEASLSDPKIASVEEIVSVEEENVVQQEEEEVNFEDISHIQDVVLREKLLSITRLISKIESLNENSTLDRVFNSFESDNSLLDNFLPEFKTFCDHSEETRSGNTTHADNSLPKYDSFFFEIEPDQERLINLENPSILRPPPEPPDVETDTGEEIPVVMNDKDKDVDYSYSMFFIFDKMFSLLFVESEDTIFDPGISD
nr:putative reverse transcriptase domain-containing protein [Tanacetum cinerariifolium]